MASPSPPRRYRHFIREAELDAASARRSPISTRATWRISAEARHAVRQAILNATLPQDLQEQIIGAYQQLQGGGAAAARCGRALLRHGRRPAGRELCRAAGDLSQCAGRRGPAGDLQALLRLALHRPRHQLPRGQGLRPFQDRAQHRRAAHGALRSRLLRRHVHHRHRDRLPRRGADQCRLRPGRERGAGLGQSGRILRLQAHAEDRATGRFCRRPSAARSSS